MMTSLNIQKKITDAYDAISCDIVKVDSLSHSGVPGMKWRTHKFGKWQKQAVYANGQDNPDAKEKEQPKQKISEMSDDELRRKTSRMRIENDYRRAAIEYDDLNRRYNNMNKARTANTLSKAFKFATTNPVSAALLVGGANAAAYKITRKLTEKYGGNFAKAVMNRVAETFTNKIIGGKKK